jgi:putative ABC transport system permease protein
MISPVIGRLAVQSMRSGIRRIGVAVFSLAIAVSMLVSVATMVSSFRETVISWVNQTLRADLYIRPAGAAANEWASTFDPSVTQQLGQLPSVLAIDRFRGRHLDFNGTPVVLASGEFSVLRNHGHLMFTDGRSMSEVAANMINQDRLIISEPFSIKQGITQGDFMQLPTPEGSLPFRIEAVFYDYSNDRGLLVMDRSTYLARFDDSSVTNLAVYLDPGTDSEETEREIAEQLSSSEFRIISNADMKRQVLRVFDQTFQITYALEAIAIVVAILGIANTLAALILERRGEFAVLRFMGTDSRQLRRVVLTESGVTGLIGIVSGTVLGIVLSLILVYVVNKQSFGWTIQFGIPAGFLLRSLLLVFAATVIAGLYPAALARRLDPIKSIRAE